MRAKLVEPELACDCQCSLSEASPFVRLARDLPDAARVGKDARRRSRDGVAGECLRSCEVLADEIVLTAIPERAREVRLRL